MATPEYPPVEIVRQSLRYEDGRLFWLVRPRRHFPDDRTWEIWIPARLLSDQESWTAMVNSEPMILDDIGSPYIRAGWCLNQIQDPARRASAEQVREDILKRVRDVSDRENARQQDRETV